MKRGRKPMMLYDLYDGEELIGKYSASELAERFGCSKSKIYSAATTYGKIDGYSLDKGIPEGFAEKWIQAVGILKSVVEKERQMVGLIPCERAGCFANSEGRCVCLTDNHFKAGCPFYKPRGGKEESESGNSGHCGSAVSVGGIDGISAVSDR